MKNFGKWTAMIGLGWFIFALTIIAAIQITGFTEYPAGFEWVGLLLFVLVYLGLAFNCPFIMMLIGGFFFALGSWFDGDLRTSKQATSTPANTHTNPPNRHR
ncbi:MAG: hypothetical protein WEB58_01065 [Planctomycetaceae bacterium]